MNGKVLIPEQVSRAAVHYLEERGYAVVNGSGPSREQVISDIRGCDAVLLRNAAMTRDIMEAADVLKVISRHGVGVDNIDLEAATQLGIQVTYAPESNANTVAEHTMALLFALTKRVVFADRRCRDGDFGVRNRLNGVDLEGKVLGLAGAGRIGKLVARKAAAFGLAVMYYDPYAAEWPAQDGFVRCGSLAELLERSDIVSLHLPLTPETRRLIGRTELRLMKPSAYLINASRGGIVDEEALVESLREERLAGAALDVFEHEPPPPDHPLFAMEQVVVTPHCASMTRECVQRMAMHAAIGIDEVLSGREPSWPVNRPGGRHAAS